MQFLQQLFRKDKLKQQPSPYKKKSSWITALCSSKPNQLDQKVYVSQNKFQMENSMSKNLKQLSSSTQSSANKQHFKVSSKFEEQQFTQLKSEIIHINERKYLKLEQIMKRSQLYGVISSQKDPLYVQIECLWLKIGKNQQLNSLSHIMPYRFQKIFMIPGQFGFQYTIQEIVACSQTICIRLKSYKEVQNFIDLWEKQLNKSFAFRSIQACCNKLTISIYKIGRSIWLNFNQQIQSGRIVKQLLQKIGFRKEDAQYETLLEEIPKGLTLQEYIQILKKKEKLENQYQKISVRQYLRHKFLQKMSKSRQINLQNQNQGVFLNKINRSNTGVEYADYFNAISNSSSKQSVRQFQDKIKQAQDKQESQEQEQIFNFNVYKDESEQQIKGVAIIKQRKIRSKSEEITNLGKTIDCTLDLDPCFYQNQ